MWLVERYKRNWCISGDFYWYMVYCKRNSGHHGNIIHRLCFTYYIFLPHYTLLWFAVSICVSTLKFVRLEILPVDRWKLFLSPQDTTSMLCIVVLDTVGYQISLAQLTSAIARPQQDRDVCVPSFRSFLHLPSRHNVGDLLIADLPSCQHSGGNVKHVKRLGISSDTLVPSGADHFNSPYLAHLWCTMV